MTPHHAVLLAGGQGTRLRPYTTTLPKPLVPIGDDCAIIEVILRQLASYGIRRVTIATGHLGSLIRAYVGDGTQWGLVADYATEDRPLGTMGPVVQLLDRLPEEFLVLNGDILTDLDFAELLDRHSHNEALMTIACYRRSVRIDFGVLQVRQDRVVAFQEKPELQYLVSMGAYALSRDALKGYRPGEPLGFDQLVKNLIAAQLPPAAFTFEGYWLDIGRPEDYDRANEEFTERRAVFLPHG